MNGSDDVMIFESPDRSNILVEDNGGQTSADDELYQYVVEDDGTVLYSDDSELAAHTTKDCRRKISPSSTASMSSMD